MLQKKLLLIFFLSISLLVHAKGITIIGHISDPTIKRLYMFSVYDEQNTYLLPFDSIEIKNQSFSYQNDTLRSQLLFITPISEKKNIEAAFLQGTYIFPVEGENKYIFSLGLAKKIKIDSTNSSLQHQYEKFQKERNIVGQKHLLDSLDQLFYTAKDKNDVKEMERLKRVSAPQYDNAYKKLRAWFDKQIAIENNTPFGIYLYYTYKLQHSKLDTKSKVYEADSILQKIKPDLQENYYYQLAFNKVFKAKNTLIGQKAPDIIGIGMNGEQISLQDFQGKYVLIDFWSSSCKWCRKETPNIRKAYDEFKSKGFIVLGVSTDIHKAEWLEAIAKDNATWNHLLLPKEQRPKILEAYNIISIPEILLVAPNGNIIAKGLRGEQIYETIKMHIK